MIRFDTRDKKPIPMMQAFSGGRVRNSAQKKYVSGRLSQNYRCTMDILGKEDIKI